MKSNLFRLAILMLVSSQAFELSAQEKQPKNQKNPFANKLSGTAAKSHSKQQAPQIIKHPGPKRDPFNSQGLAPEIKPAPKPIAAPKVRPQASKAQAVVAPKKFAIMTDSSGKPGTQKVEVKINKDRITSVVFSGISLPVIREAGHAPYIEKQSSIGKYRYFVLREQLSPDGSKYIALVPARNKPKLVPQAQVEPEMIQPAIDQLNELNGVDEATNEPHMGEQPDSMEDTEGSDQEQDESIDNSGRYSEEQYRGEEYYEQDQAPEYRPEYYEYQPEYEDQDSTSNTGV